LVKHDLLNKSDEMGQTLTIILQSLRNLGYFVSWQVFDASNFGGLKQGSVFTSQVRLIHRLTLMDLNQ
jgi:hypothetical protein